MSQKQTYNILSNELMRRLSNVNKEETSTHLLQLKIMRLGDIDEDVSGETQEDNLGKVTVLIRSY